MICDIEARTLRTPKGNRVFTLRPRAPHGWDVWEDDLHRGWFAIAERDGGFALADFNDIVEPFTIGESSQLIGDLWIQHHEGVGDPRPPT